MSIVTANATATVRTRDLLPPWPAEQLIRPLFDPPPLPLQGAAPLGEGREGKEEDDDGAGEAAGSAVPASRAGSDVADRDCENAERDSAQPSAQGPGVCFPEALQ